MVSEPQDKSSQSLGSGDSTMYVGPSSGGAGPTAVASQSTVRLPVQDANRLPIGTRLTEFEITGVVGEGGFGIVYTAHDHSLDREVAIKEYMPTSLATRYDRITVTPRSGDAAETFDTGLRSFVNEAKMLARFDHPSLLKVYRFWEANGTAYMAMPYYKGVTLRQRLRQSGAPDERWLRAMLEPLLDALDVIHRENIFHRDIAPDNIFLLADDRPVLLDFGAARRVIGDKTHALTVILKPGFAPVEQYADVPKLKQGPWTDLYALAAVVYCAVSGEKPPPSIGRYVSDSMAPLSELGRGRYSAEFLTAIDVALRVHPDERPQNADEFRALLAVGSPRPAIAALQDRFSASPPPSQSVAGAAAPEATVRVRTEGVAKTEVLPEVAKMPPPASVASAASGRTEVIPPRAAHIPVIETVADIRSPDMQPRSTTLIRVAIVIAALALLAGGGFFAMSLLNRPGSMSPVVSQPISPVVQAPSPQPMSPVTPASASVSATRPEQASPPVAAPAPVTESATAAPAAAVVRKLPIAASKNERLNRLIADANASFSHSDFAKAQGFATQALALDPHNPAALAIRDKAQKAAWSEVQIQ